MAMNQHLSDVPNYIEVGVARISPNSGKKFYTPVVNESIKPVKGMTFDSSGHGYAFYRRYALASGFTIRKCTTYGRVEGFYTLRYFVCSREGFKPLSTKKLKNPDNVKRRRSKSSIRCGCHAHIRLRYNAVTKKYVVYSFEEEHNHSLVAKPDVQFLPGARVVDHVKESAIQSLSNINVGPVRAYNIMKSLYGGYENVGASKNDFKNYKRDLNEYIGDYDAEMVIQMLMKKKEAKKEFLPNFSFDYTKKEDGSLGGLFWADEVSKKNYQVFGDVVGFDATYRTNK